MCNDYGNRIPYSGYAEEFSHLKLCLVTAKTDSRREHHANRSFCDDEHSALGEAPLRLLIMEGHLALPQHQETENDQHHEDTALRYARGGHVSRNDHRRQQLCLGENGQHQRDAFSTGTRRQVRPSRRHLRRHIERRLQLPC
jgi:hypothetical protein